MNMETHSIKDREQSKRTTNIDTGKKKPSKICFMKGVSSGHAMYKPPGEGVLKEPTGEKRWLLE
jgi:hypothetical protein